MASSVLVKEEPRVDSMMIGYRKGPLGDDHLPGWPWGFMASLQAKIKVRGILPLGFFCSLCFLFLHFGLGKRKFCRDPSLGDAKAAQDPPVGITKATMQSCRH